MLQRCAYVQTYAKYHNGGYGHCYTGIDNLTAVVQLMLTQAFNKRRRVMKTQLVRVTSVDHPSRFRLYATIKNT